MTKIRKEKERRSNSKEFSGRTGRGEGRVFFTELILSFFPVFRQILCSRHVGIYIMVRPFCSLVKWLFVLALWVADNGRTLGC